MRASYVIDASAAALTFLDDERSPAYRTWLRGVVRDRARLIAPTLLPYELANTIHKVYGATGHREDEDFARKVLRSVLAPMTLHDDCWASTWTWAGRLSAYDAAYLALAESTSSTLVTYDRRLGDIAAAAVAVIGCTGLP